MWLNHGTLSPHSSLDEARVDDSVEGCRGASLGESQEWPQKTNRSTTPDDLPLKDYIAKLRRDVKKLRAELQDRRKHLDAATAELQSEAKANSAAQKELEQATAEVSKLRKGIIGAKDMILMNQRELREVESDLELQISRAGMVSPNTAPFSRSRRNRRLAAAATAPNSARATPTCKTPTAAAAALKISLSKHAVEAEFEHSDARPTTAPTPTSRKGADARHGSLPYVLRQKEYMSDLDAKPHSARSHKFHSV
eukprot:TRINITY_DN39821_c0_g1_i1.p1 TRINITY_DN39821_c0_g1~~TRINITY_DN39821_c0_g1_i1.p1  ORF type:complete len:253 (-),score=55.53 TRINITY_DN39821_c0_g1_i1:59-817(-)